jgi:hypothetical protein
VALRQTTRNLGFRLGQLELYQEALWAFGIDASAMAVTALQGQFRTIRIGGLSEGSG